MRVDTWGGPGRDLGEFDRPTGLAVNRGDTLYVADTALHRITLFDYEGSPITAWTVPGSGPGQLTRPADLAVDLRGDLYVSDAGNERIQRLRADGTFVDAVGERGSGDGQFQGPSGITVAPDRQLYVADSGNRRIQQFDARQSPPRFVRALAEGTLPGPSDVCVDSSGFIYAIDWVGGEIVKLDADGTEVLRWGGEGGQPDEPPIPFSAVIEGDALHVTDIINGRVQTYDLQGNLESEWPADGIPVPSRITTGPSGRLFVTSSDARVVVVFQLPVGSTPSRWGDVKSLFR